MILLLDTSTATCRFAFYDGERYLIDETWEAGRDLAEQLHAYIERHLESFGRDWQDITGIGVYKGPGSFTGLRIGLAVLNTIADANNVPIVGETGEDWRAVAIERLKSGANERIVLPLYGREANITKPRKWQIV